MMVGAKWLRNGVDAESFNRVAAGDGSGSKFREPVILDNKIC